MNTRVLIIIVIVIVALTVVSVVMGVNRDEPKSQAEKDRERQQYQDNPPSFTTLLERGFGWLTPGFNFDDLTISGATLKDQRLTLDKDAEVTLTVRPLPNADKNDCRTLKLVLVSPKVTSATERVVSMQVTLRAPKPKMDSADDEPALPNPTVEPDAKTKQIDLEKLRSYAIPIFAGGATIQLTAERACVVELH
jgi:hypothetical protein